MPQATESPDTSTEAGTKPPIILVGTHHKTGTVWMGNLFRQLAERLGRSYFIGPPRDVPADVDIFQHVNSGFNMPFMARLQRGSRPWRGIHIIRDPRDVIVSGCFYHQKSEERWLHIPTERFGGLTYQEAINSTKNVERQLLFEMEHRGRETIGFMLRWNYQRPHFMELRYEDLIQDEQLAEFRRAFVHLGLTGGDLETALDVAHSASLFGGFKSELGKSLHLRSGETAQWRAHFTPALVARFKEMFPGGLAKLGYESSDDTWGL